MTRRAPREGETRLPFDPAEAKPDASLVFIGRVHSPWSDPSQMPKNPGRARELGQTATLEIDAAYRQGLAALGQAGHVAIFDGFEVIGVDAAAFGRLLEGETAHQALVLEVPAGLAERIDIRCFRFDPSLNSSLVFLRKTPWARAKVEALYVAGKRRP